MRAILAAFSLVAAYGMVTAGDRDQGRWTLETVLDCSVDQAWDAWTTKQGVEGWMGAKGEVDFRVGGKYRTSYNANATLGDDSTIENEILSFDPQRMITFRNVKAPKGFKLAAPFSRTWSIVYFEKLNDKQTKLTYVGLGYTDEPEMREVRKHFEQGNAYVFEKLKKYLAK